MGEKWNQSQFMSE